MQDLDVIDDPKAAALALDPVRNRLLAELNTPASAAALAARIGLTRQKVNYHLRALEAVKLIKPAKQRQWGGLTERLMVATAKSYVVSPGVLGSISVSPEHMADRLSASYLIALVARAVREVGALWRKACKTDKRLATLSIDTMVRFKSPADRAAFTNDLAGAIASLVGRYHDDKAPRGRTHRLVIVCYPGPANTSS
jgi:DNA-binding transcriptional ArsR family regulator